MNSTRRVVAGLAAGLVLLAVAGVAGAASRSAGYGGQYAGRATKGTTTVSKGRKLAFSVKVVANCPMADGTFKRALCLSWTPGISMPVVCAYWNDADPTHRPADERRAVPALAPVSATGRVDFSTMSSGPGYSDATRLTVTLRNGRATGKVTYTAKGRSSIVSKDCTGRLEFTARRR